MQNKTLQMKRALRTALLVLLLSVAGMGKMNAQSFTVDDLNYTVNSNGTSVTLTGPSDGNYWGQLDIPNSVVHGGVNYAVTAIGDNAFENCSLTGLTIGNSVVEIGDSAFSYCWGLEGSLVIPNSVTTIGNRAFNSCGFTGNLVIPNSVTTIGDWAFGGCEGFTGNLVIPNSVTTIGEGAFASCRHFSGTLTIPNSVTTISGNAFAVCSGFTGMLTIPDSVTTIGDWAFSCCEGFTGLTIGSSVTTIGNNAFQICLGFEGNLVIPNSVTTIGEEAFLNCAGFTGTLTIPNSVTSINGNAFEYCNGIEQITVEAGNAVYDSRNNCNGIIETSTNMLITGCKNAVIPNTVVSIGEYAFSGCEMDSINIPNSVVTIGASAFSSCSNLTSIVIPSSVTTIGRSSFSGCNSLGQITVEAENPVYDSRDNCNAIIESGTNVLISGCMNTAIPNSVNTIGSGAFANCSNLTSIVIPLSVTKIESSAFCYCGLTGDLVIPNSVSSVEDHVFYGCYNLNGNLTLGSSLAQIGDHAFYECDGLLTVVSLASTPPALYSVETFGWEGMDRLIVSCASKEAYEASDWANCFNIIEEDCSPHNIALDEISDGNVSASVSSTELGEEVQLTVTPNEGMELVSLIVSNTNNPEQTVPVYPLGKTSSIYGFIMPPFDVIITATFGPATTIGENNEAMASVYPNPTNGQIKIEAEGLKHITISNMLGQIIYDGNVIGNEFIYDFSIHNAGIYLIRIETANGVAVKKVSVTR